MKIARTSIALLGFQLLLVSTIAAKYFYQRATCPRVWTRAAAYDPSLVMRGRYLSLQLTVDACGSTLPSAKSARFPRDRNGVPNDPRFTVQSLDSFQFPARMVVENNRLQAIKIPDSQDQSAGQMVFASPNASCDQMRLMQPVDFYIAEHADDPTFVKPNQELWIEVTVPPKGPPRPLQLALKDEGKWRPLAFN